MSRLSPLILTLAISTVAAAATPVTVGHSGYVLAAADVPLDDPAAPFVFELYDRSGTSGQVLLWSASCDVAVKAGYYAVDLGAAPCAGTSTLDTTALPANATRWLQVEVGGVTLSPRLSLSPLPAAAVALDATHLGGVAASALVDSVTGKLLASALPDGGVTNAHLASNAAVAVTKLAAGTNGQVLTTVGTTPTWASPTGGVTGFNTRTGAVTLTSGDVTGALGYTPVNPGANVGLGTPSPTARLEIAGTAGSTLRIADGNQASGKVLASDATGAAAWQYAGGLANIVGSINGSSTSGGAVTGGAYQDYPGGPFSLSLPGPGTYFVSEHAYFVWGSGCGDVQTHWSGASIVNASLDGKWQACGASGNNTWAAYTFVITVSAASTITAKYAWSGTGTGTVVFGGAQFIRIGL